MAIEYQRRRFTIEEFEKLFEIEILRREDRIELIEGELVVMSPIGNDHSWITIRLTRLLTTRFEDPYAIGIQGPLRLERYSMPLPDGVVMQPEAAYSGRLMTLGDVLLVVEVSASSLRYDRLKKGPLYAKYRIPEYWIVDVGAEAVEVYRDAGDAGYASVTRAVRGERIPTRVLPGDPPLVDALFLRPGETLQR